MPEELNVDEMASGTLVTELVSLKGGIHYDRKYEDSYFDDNAEIRQWKTVSRIDNPQERLDAQRLRGKIYQLVRSCCVKTPVGLICDDSRKSELIKALQEVKKERDQFNKQAKTCRVTTHHACFEVKSDNHETISAIMEQIAEVASNVNCAITQDDEKTLQQTPRKWLKGMKPSAILLLPEAERNAIIARARAELIRKAIREIKGVERLLPEDAGKRTKALVNESRLIARKICNKVERHNASLDEVLEEVDLTGIRRNRAAFVLAAAKADKRALEDESQIPLLGARKLILFQE
jgi:hypothetical protein